MIAAIAASISASSSVRSWRPERQAVRQALLVDAERAAAVDVEQPDVSQGRAAVLRGSPRRRRRRPRSPRRRPQGRARWPDGAAGARRSRPPGGPPPRPLRSSSATTTRAPRRSHASTTVGWSSPTSPASDEPPVAVRLDPRGAARMEQRLAALRAVRRLVEAEAPREQVDRALRVVEVVRASRAVERGRIARAGRRPGPAATTRARAPIPRRRCRSRHSPCRSRRSATSSTPWRRFVETTWTRLPTSAGRRTEWSAESGFVTTIGRPPSGSAPSTVGSGDSQRKASAIRGATRACVTTSVSPAPASVSRIASRTSSGGSRYGGIGVSGRISGISS